ncbi:MAG: redoxin domain-containing protein [Pseudomonadales bacterium]|nr:redoxin domain-containing protein [Pseudomonadales bacterium]
MRKIGLVAALLSAGVFNTALAAPERAGDFALLDQQGEFHQLSRYRHKDAVVIMALAEGCATLDSSIAAFQQLNAAWQDKEVAFLMISSGGESLQDIRAQVAARNLAFPVLMDSSQMVASTLKLSSVGEVVVLDPDRLTVLYRGPVDERINVSLQKELAGVSQDTMVMPVSACELHIPGSSVAAEVPDYATEIAPIIVENCADCHREGGIGPFAMNSHLMLQGWSPMIRETLLTRRMPPMQVDPNIGHFNNANYLDAGAVQKLVRWIDAGAPRGNVANDPLNEVAHVDMRAWQLGEPDYVIKMPAHEIPATGVLEYIDVTVELPFTEDKYVKAVQFIPGDPSVLHHLLTYVTAPNENFDGGEADQRSIARRFLEGYAPGKVAAMTFPEDVGVYVPAGHKLSAQFHYTTNGRATTDETLLGLYMYDEKPRYENLTRSVSGRFTIPPHARDHKAHAEYVFNDDVYINGLRAHMHFRGKNMKFSVEYPDGSMEELLSEVNYNYAWQPTYQLSEHKFLPAGTRVHVDGSFDNSVYNPANPDPDQEIGFGLQSWDEMFIGYWTYYVADK